MTGGVAELLDDLGDPAKTRLVGLYKMIDGRSFDRCWEVTDDADADAYDSIEVPGLGDEALVVFGRRRETECEWVDMVRDLTDLDLGYTTAEPSAVIFVRVDGHGFALSYGGGFRLLVGAAIDRGFGLNFALRAIDADEVRHVRRQHFNAKARVDSSSVPGGEALWSFGIREHAELVRQITGKAIPAGRFRLSHLRKMEKRRTPRISIDCTERVRLPLPHSAEHLVHDLREVLRVLREHEVAPDLAPLQWIRRLGPDEDELLDAAWSMLFDELLAFSDDVSLAYPARYHGGAEVSRFVGQIGSHVIATPELQLLDVRAGLADRLTDEARLQALRAGRITGLDDDGTGLGGAEAALHWLSAAVDLPDGLRLVLLDGDWFDLTDAYTAHVDRVIREAFANRPVWSLPAWNAAPGRPEDGRREEKLYNAHAGQLPGFLCLDRKLVRTRVHPCGFEACDLLGPDQELIHVKKVSSQTGSGPLSHLFAQGIVAAESLTDRATWDKFVGLVQEHDPDRARALGSRPRALVYAIHRSDGPLTPERLFTFARSELASASILFSKLGIPLQICVIP
jgi:uncharacterized protein (TIGR04141 family)